MFFPVATRVKRLDVVDRTAPKVTLKGAERVYIEAGFRYEDADDGPLEQRLEARRSLTNQRLIHDSFTTTT